MIKSSEKTKLLVLSSDNPKFKTLKFNPGLNIVSGIQLSEEDKKTFNGIGKSLSLKLIHFIFGGSFKGKDELKFEEYLKKYGTFSLKFSHAGKEYEVSKNFSEAAFYINNEKIAKSKYPQKLNEIFGLDSSPISFTQMFNSFARKFGGSQYSDVISQQGRPLEDYYQK